MKYEFKVSEMAEEFGVHSTTVKNWIKSGSLPAKEGPGANYLMEFSDYQNFCGRFGVEPSVRPINHVHQDPCTIQQEAHLVQEPLVLDGKRSELAIDPNMAASCVTCGTCAAACPITGCGDGMDPRKIVRMAAMGMDKELIESKFPWMCTMCGKCEESCPADIQIIALMRKIRGTRERDLVPGPIHKGVAMCLDRGNNLGIPKDDFVFLCEDLGEELAEDCCPGFKTPLDVEGARVMLTVNSKEPFGEPDDMKWWWKILYAAGESWTIPTENWEGVNWGLFSGDDESQKEIVGRLVANMRRLKCKVLLLPEWGHAYFATRSGLVKWFPEFLEEFQIMTVFDLLLEYIKEDKIKLDTSVHAGLPTAYHDPCNYGRKSLKTFGQAYFEEGREVAAACCDDLRELNPNRNSAYCCGAGGGAWALPYSDERIYYGRTKARQIQESGAKLVVAPCHNCRDQIMKALTPEYDLGIEVKYLWELIADSLIMPGKDKAEPVVSHHM